MRSATARTLGVFLAVLLLPALRAGDRTVISLDGEWDIADSNAPLPLPSVFTGKAPVPGLAHSAVPRFPDVDEFESRDVILNRISKGMLPKSALVHNAGISHQTRSYFWYHRKVRVGQKRAAAMLRINKAQFGASVWVNGRFAGEHLPCFTAAVFDVSAAVRWNAENEIVVRIGAHPGVLPEQVTFGTDFEKNRWTPGIYDRVSLLLSDNPAIETVQVAPRLADSSIVVQTKVRNLGGDTIEFALSHSVHGWKSQAAVASLRAARLTLKPREERTITQTIHLPNAKLWWPEDPNLYVLESSTGGDSESTRFGMREFRFQTSTKRAYLNGRVYFLRGSNITLHRFFEDPESGTLPWDDHWVRRLLIDIPKQMHWNTFRFCIGPVPDRWLEIADEAGLLIQNEYFVWTGHDWHGAENQVHFDGPEMIREYSEWMRDNWNHPSVVIWDANNESWDPLFGKVIIPAVRGLDLSNRPWENSYNPPVGPDDPVEDHPYEFLKMATGGPPFSMTELETPGRVAPGVLSGHALILNEYGWLWLNRDGSPTELTKQLYPRLLDQDATAQDRFALNAYLLAGITEFWRAYRQYAGVLHFVYLTSSDPLGFTADHFRDVKSLELEPNFREYLSNAFAPLGVYLSFWQETAEAGSRLSLPVMLINDEAKPVQGTVAVSIESEAGEDFAQESAPFALAPLGQETLNVDVQVPRTAGNFLMKATALPAGGHEPTVSRRRIRITAANEDQH